VLTNPFGGPMRVRRPDGHVEVVAGDVLSIATSPGEVLSLTPAPADEL